MANKRILIGLFVIITVGFGVAAYFFIIPRCPRICDDRNICTQDVCSSATGFKCSFVALSGPQTGCSDKITCGGQVCKSGVCQVEYDLNCCGNKTCEVSEKYEICPLDCPNCDDNNNCTKDHFDYHNLKCVNAPNLNNVCCGNTACEVGEVYANCPRDCPDCDDDNQCTKDKYNYNKLQCVNEVIIPCCGNKICDKGAEKYLNCSADCPSCDDNSKLTSDNFNYTSQKCEHTITHYVFDNFENGAGDWEFFGKEEKEPTSTNWTVAKDGANTVLKGAGHNWAGILSKKWPDYIFKTRFKIIKEGGGIHFNFRNTMGESNPMRYFIWVGSNGINLAKQINEKFFDSLAQPQNFPGFGKDLINVWHTFEIRGYGNTLNILIDDQLLIKYKDDNSPVLSGGVAFETLNGSEFLIDDVEVKVISSKDVIYP